jgi:rod shape-determining protein MreC
LQRLFTIVQLFKEYVAFVFLVIISLILLSANDNQQIHALRSYTVGFIGAMQNALSIVPNVFELRRENEVLRKLNVDLSDEVGRLREARLENLKLRAMIGLREHTPLRFVAADVVGKNLYLLRNTITLNVGEHENIKPEMPIVSAGGLVGKTIDVSTHYSLGQLMLNKDFRASAKVQRSRVDGIAAWDGGAVMHLKDVAKTQDVKEGDVVVTSEYSNVYPKDIRIGVVSRVSEKPGALFKEIEIVPSVDFSALEQVFVVTAMQDTERVRLEKKVTRLK